MPTVDTEVKDAMKKTLVNWGCSVTKQDNSKGGWELIKNEKGKTIFKSSYIGNGNYLVKWIGDLFTLETI